MLIALFGLWCGHSDAQTEVPVFTDDSPEAADLFATAAAQAHGGNTPEALRLYQRLLNQFPGRLVSRESEGDSATSTRTRYITVRARVHGILTGDSDLLTQYRSINEPLARRDLRDGRNEDVYRSRFLTRSGLEAGLGLAEEALVRAAFTTARAVLGECADHPAHDDTTRQRWATLTALVGLYGDDDDLFAVGVESLRGPGAETKRDQLLIQADARGRPRRIDVQDPTDGLHQATLEDMGRSPTWRTSVNTTATPATGIRRMGGADPDGLAGTQRIIGLLAAMPVVAGDFIYVHDGLTLTALDRFDGRERWRADYRNALTRDTTTRFRPFDFYAVQNDPALPAVHQNRVVALVQRSMGDVESRTALICHDAQSGAALWSRSPARLHDDLAGAIFTGVPVAAEGYVFTIARRQAQRLASDYLVAVDIHTGELVWRQHLASSAIFGYATSLPSAAPLWHEGVLYVSCPFGALTAIQAHSGEVLWLNLMSPFGPRPQSETPARWAWDAPVMTPVGLVTFSPDRRGIVQVDPHSGETITFHAASTWNTPRYLVADDEALFAVGREIVRIELDDFTSAAGNFVPLRDRDEVILGRVSAGEGRLLVPTSRRLLLVDSRTGAALGDVGLNDPGVGVLVGGEVVLATLEGIESYMPYSIGEPHLRARLAADPDDPNPAISLARLAFQHRKIDALLEPIDHAIDVISRDPLSEINEVAQQRLYDGLLDMAPHAALSPELSDALFYRLELLVANTQQRLGYLLTYGARLSQSGRIAEAVDAYQAVLSNEALAGEFWGDAAHRVRARMPATAQLRVLVTQHGRSIYAPYEEAARRELEAAMGRNDAEALLAAARRNPMASAAPRACLEAARQYRASDRIEHALHALRIGLSLDPPSEVESVLHGNLLHLLADQGRYDEAFRVVSSIERRTPAALIQGPDAVEPMTASQWRRHLEELEDLVSRPARIGAIGSTADLKDGPMLLLPMFGRPSAEFAAIREGRNLFGYGTGAAAEFLEVLDTPSKEILLVEEGRVLLVPTAGRGPRLVDAFSPTKRRMLWQSPLFEDLFDDDGAATDAEDPGDDGELRVGRQPGFAQARRATPGRILPLVTPQSVVLVEESSGRVGALDRRTGHGQWTAEVSMDRVVHATAGPSGIVLAGEQYARPTRARRDIDGFPLVVLDPVSGAVIHEDFFDRATPLEWLVVTDAGELIHAGRGEIGCYDIQRREHRWFIEDESLAGPAWMGAIGTTVLVFRNEGTAARLDPATGTLTEMPQMAPIEPRLAAAGPIGLHPHRGRFVLKTHNGLYVLDGDGSLLGRMVRSGDREVNVRGVACAEDRMVAVVVVADQPGGQARRVELHSMDYTGRRLERPIELDARTELPRFDGVQAMDGWIVVDAGRDVLFVPAPVE